jgi:hypothetical protein
MLRRVTTDNLFFSLIFYLFRMTEKSSPLSLNPLVMYYLLFVHSAVRVKKNKINIKGRQSRAPYFFVRDAARVKKHNIDVDGRQS